jgi:hypothetical protein
VHLARRARIVDVDAAGRVTGHSIRNDSRESARNLGEFERLIERMEFIPAYRDGKPVPATYAESIYSLGLRGLCWRFCKRLSNMGFQISMDDFIGQREHHCRLGPGDRKGRRPVHGLCQCRGRHATTACSVGGY